MQRHLVSGMGDPWTEGRILCLKERSLSFLMGAVFWVISIGPGFSIGVGKVMSPRIS